jgi:hypothetical protein
LEVSLDVLVSERVVLVSRSLLGDVLVLVSSCGGEDGLGINSLGEVNSQVKILEHEVNSESTSILSRGWDTLKNAWDWVVLFDNEGSSSRNSQNLGQSLGVSSQFLSERQSLRGSHHNDSENVVVNNLGNRSSSWGSASEEVSSHSAQWISNSVQSSIVGSNHKGKGSVGGSNDTSRHWRIVHLESVFLSLLNELDRGQTRNGRNINDLSTLNGVLEYTSISLQSLGNDVTVWQAGNDVVSSLNCILNRGSLVASVLSGGGDSFLAEIKSSDGESVLDEVVGHGESHVSETDESNGFLASGGEGSLGHEFLEHSE